MMRMHSVFAVLTVLATFSVIVVLRDAGVTRRGGGVGLEEQVVNEREGDNETREEEKRVVSQIETCLLATNVSTYLEERGYLSVAYDNGRNMIRTLRTIIPRTFSTEYLSPCWKADFNGSVQLQDQTVKWFVDGREIVTPFSSLV